MVSGCGAGVGDVEARISEIRGWRVGLRIWRSGVGVVSEHHHPCAHLTPMAATSAPSAAAELRTLRLDDILSDLDMLSSDDALFTLARSSAPTTTRTHTGEDLLSSFERGSLDASTPQDRRKAYVALSHALVAGFAHASRLNTERASAAQVGLVLPSERTQSGSSRPTAAHPQSQDATRADLLHSKVATLQTQADAWHAALASAVGQQPESSEERRRQDAAIPSTREADIAHGSQADTGTSDDRMASELSDANTKATTEAEPAPAPEEAAPRLDATPAAPDFEDDDPWNDLS